MKEPIRVLCVFSTLDRGGAESMCMNLYRHIDRSKIQFDFVKHTSGKGSFEDEIKLLGGRIFEAPRLKLSTIIEYRTWWKKHLDNHPEHYIIHGHFFTISAVYFQIAKQKGRITVGHIHISKPDNVRKAVLCHFINRYTDYPLACSKVAGKWVYGKRSFKILNNAIETDNYLPNEEIARMVRNELLLGDSFVIGSVGRFNLQKNPFGILEIFRLVYARRPNSKLLWVGDGPMMDEIKKKVNGYHLEKAVVFTGSRNDVNRLLQAMDVFVFPSFYEGLGIAAVEAQAAGIPSFCSSEVPQEVKVTNLCHFLPIDDYTTWADEICKMPSTMRHFYTRDQVVNAGYDIHETSEWTQNFYSSISSKYQ